MNLAEVDQLLFKICIVAWMVAVTTGMWLNHKMHQTLHDWQKLQDYKLAELSKEKSE